MARHGARSIQREEVAIDRRYRRERERAAEGFRSIARLVYGWNGSLRRIGVSAALGQTLDAMVTAPTVRASLQPYVPRLTLQWLDAEPDQLHREVQASMVFVDISGFTKLSEKLAKLGKLGAEEIAASIDSCFAHCSRSPTATMGAC